jgi:hypothetical protein
VRGRRSGRVISFPVVIADFEGERYLVSMLGENANWVRNLKAAGYQAVLRHGRRETVRLQKVDVAARAPILRCYLRVAPGARPHIPVDFRAPVAEFEKVAADYPVFRIDARPASPEPRCVQQTVQRPAAVNAARARSISPAVGGCTSPQG